MTSNDIKRAALQRRADLEAEIQKIDEILRILGNRANEQPTHPTPTCPGPQPKPEQSGLKKIIRDAIVQGGKPLSRSELVDALSDAGSPLDSKNPANYVGTMMWRWRDVFVNFKGIGYWPADLPYEPTRYVPHL